MAVKKDCSDHSHLLQETPYSFYGVNMSAARTGSVYIMETVFFIKVSYIPLLEGS